MDLRVARRTAAEPVTRSSAVGQTQSETQTQTQTPPLERQTPIDPIDVLDLANVPDPIQMPAIGMNDINIATIPIDVDDIDQGGPIPVNAIAVDSKDSK